LRVLSTDDGSFEVNDGELQEEDTNDKTDWRKVNNKVEDSNGDEADPETNDGTITTSQNLALVNEHQGSSSNWQQEGNQKGASKISARSNSVGWNDVDNLALKLHSSSSVDAEKSFPALGGNDEEDKTSDDTNDSVNQKEFMKSVKGKEGENNCREKQGVGGTKESTQTSEFGGLKGIRDQNGNDR